MGARGKVCRLPYKLVIIVGNCIRLQILHFFFLFNVLTIRAKLESYWWGLLKACKNDGEITQLEKIASMFLVTKKQNPKQQKTPKVTNDSVCVRSVGGSHRNLGFTSR